MKIERTRIYFFSDVFATVAVLGSYGPWNGATALVRVKSCETKVTVLSFKREHERKPGY